MITDFVNPLQMVAIGRFILSPSLLSITMNALNNIYGLYSI